MSISSLFLHVTPDLVRADNGPQFAGEPFKTFSQNWSLRHDISPLFPQSNGEAERAVRTVKGLLKKSSDSYLVLMAYCTVPLANGYSPTALLERGQRKIQTKHR